MAQSEHPLGKSSIIASGAVSRNRFIGFDGALCAANARALGVSDYAVADGGDLAYKFGGIVLVESGGALSAGNAVVAGGTGADAGRAVAATTFSVTSSVDADSTPVTSTAANGEIITNTLAGAVLPQVINGYVLDDASGAGELVRVLLAA
jgi:hypothetical protein